MIPVFPCVCVCVCVCALNGSKLIDDLMVYRPFWDKELLESLFLCIISPLLLCVCVCACLLKLQF